MRKENWIKHFLNTQSRSFLHFAPLVAHQPTGEAVHQLRMATRRVRASLWVLRHCPDTFHGRFLDKKLKRLGRALGRVRELDVAILDAKRFYIDTQALKTRRTKAQENVRKLTNQRHRKILEENLIACGKRVKPMWPQDLRKARRLLHARLKLELKIHIHGQGSIHRPCLQVTNA